MSKSADSRTDAMYGCLLGTAVGDACGLLFEGLSKTRARKLYGDSIAPRWFRSLNGEVRGMVSDDTDHAIITSYALLRADSDVKKFQAILARSLKLWFLALPAGIGLATLKSCIKLYCGISPEKSGVKSAGNGPLMRASIIGVFYGDNHHLLRQFVDSSTRITHSDELAAICAQVISFCAWYFSISIELSHDDFFYQLKEFLGSLSSIYTEEILTIVKLALDSSRFNESTGDFASQIGQAHSISGYVMHTTPVVIQACWRNHSNLEAAILELIKCGGDTDTTAAIAGGIIGSRLGASGIPLRWQRALWLWPQSTQKLFLLSDNLSKINTSSKSLSTNPPSYIFYLCRNSVFWIILWFHVIRRILPPY